MYVLIICKTLLLNYSSDFCFTRARLQVASHAQAVVYLLTRATSRSVSVVAEFFSLRTSGAVAFDTASDVSAFAFFWCF